MRLLVPVLLLVACGGSATPSTLAGCWNYEMRDAANAVVASGALHLTDGAAGDFSLVTALPLAGAPAGGIVFTSHEPDDSVAMLLYTSGSHLLFDVVAPKLGNPLTGHATSQELARNFAFSASRCP